VIVNRHEHRDKVAPSKEKKYNITSHEAKNQAKVISLKDNINNNILQFKAAEGVNVNLNLNLKVKNTYKINNNGNCPESKATQIKPVKVNNSRSKPRNTLLNNTTTKKKLTTTTSTIISNEKKLNLSHSKKEQFKPINNNVIVLNNTNINKLVEMSRTGKSLKGTISDISKSRNISKNNKVTQNEKPNGNLKSTRLTFVEPKIKKEDVVKKLAPNDTKSRNRPDTEISKNNTTTDNKSFRNNNFLTMGCGTVTNTNEKIKIKEITTVNPKTTTNAAAVKKNLNIDSDLALSKLKKCKILY
jgi:hypothetical protein